MVATYWHQLRAIVSRSFLYLSEVDLIQEIKSNCGTINMDIFKVLSKFENQTLYYKQVAELEIRL